MKHMYRVNILFLMAVVCGYWAATAQQARGTMPFSLPVQPVFWGQQIALEQPLRTTDGDSLVLHTLRFYLSNFVFLKNGEVVFSENNSCYLLDLEDEKSLLLNFQLPQNADFDTLQFDFGVDSATTVLGAMGGDLDPTHGMFWTWQSGYIHFKIEGFALKNPARNHTFQFHLGGYLPPFQTCKTVKTARPPHQARLQLDLFTFFEKINWSKKPGIMSPCREAVELFEVLAQSFLLHD